MVFCSLIASSAIRAFISALKLRRCLDFISAPFPRQRFYTLLTGPNFGEHLTLPVTRLTVHLRKTLERAYSFRDRFFRYEARSQPLLGVRCAAGGLLRTAPGARQKARNPEH